MKKFTNERKILLYKSCWTDKNRNKWSPKLFSRDEALAASASLIDCLYCKNCRDCIGCEFCTSCNNSKYCVASKYCTGCVGCRYCKDCIDCIDCIYCNELEDYKNFKAEIDNNYMMVSSIMKLFKN